MNKISTPIFDTSTWWGNLLSKRWIRHISYWLLIVVFFGFFWGSSMGNYGKIILSEIILLPGKMAAVYFCVDFLVPRYLLTKRYSHFILLSITAMITLGLFQRVIVYYVLIGWNSVYLDLPFGNPYEIMHLIIDINTVMVIPLGVRLLRIFYHERVEATELAKSKFEAELQFLKNQVQPHFLFNTLNTLYGLILKRSDKAGEVVLKLSDLMRYLLYETSTEKVSLEKEIDHIKNYISLEKLRYGDRVETSFTIQGGIKNRFIAPMLLLHFIENSFKHGVANSLDNAWITIDFIAKKDSYHLRVENSKPPVAGYQHTNASEVFSGVGLQNVKRRLDLLYKENYSLEIENHSETYIVLLEIKDL
jgi:sensor histidine kinase YesM